MAWADEVRTLNAAVSAEFGLPATFMPQDGAGGWLTSQSITVNPVRPAMLEDYPPGFGPGTAVLRVWVNFETITPSLQHGDQIVFNGVTYMVQEVEAEADPTGGATLKLRAT
jgi:hypothetical protein